MTKTTFTLLLAIISAFFLLESCSPFSKVYSEEEPGINLNKYHTYHWLDNTATIAGNAGPEWLSGGAQGKIRTAVAGQMSRYGFKPCDDKPDLMLHYHIVVKNEVLFVPDWTCATTVEGPGQYDRCNRLRPMNYREGTLIIDFIDTNDGNQVWRGAAVGILENLKAEDTDARIQAAVEAIFKKYPEKPLPALVQ